MHARYEVFLENYNKTINVEGQLMVLMANRYILPAAFEYQKQVGQSVAAVKAAGGSRARRARSCWRRTRSSSTSSRRRPTRWRRRSSTAATARPRSTRSTCATRSCPAMAKLREIGDEIEVLTPHEIWPLPTYREMLFVK